MPTVIRCANTPAASPYVAHTIEVSRIVATVAHTDDMLCAALLHDVVEDTAVTIEQINSTFGSSVADMVAMLSDVSKPGDGNRQPASTQANRQAAHCQG